MRNALLTSTITILLLSACTNPQRYVAHQKERNEPQPQRFEAPYNQTREKLEKISEKNQTTIPDNQAQSPEVIKQELFRPEKESILFGISIQGREGLILSPYAPDKGLIDVRGFPPGSQVQDPYTNQIIKVPMPLKIKEQNETLSTPTFQTPSTSTPTPTTTKPNAPTIEAPPVLE